MKLLTRRTLNEMVKAHKYKGFAGVLDRIAEEFYESRFPMRMERMMVVEQGAFNPPRDVLLEQGEILEANAGPNDSVGIHISNSGKNPVRFTYAVLPMRKIYDPAVARIAARDILEKITTRA